MDTFAIMAVSTGAIMAIGLGAIIMIGIGSLIHYSVAAGRDDRLRKEIFKPGNTVRLYECLSEEFADYEEYDAFAIDSVINTKARITRKGEKDYDYKDLSFIGNGADLIKVYGEDGQLVGRYKHNDNASMLHWFFLREL